MARRKRPKATTSAGPKGQKSRFPYIHTYITIVRTVYQVLFWILSVPGAIGIWGVPVLTLVGQQADDTARSNSLEVVLAFCGAMLITVIWFFSYIAVMASIDLLKVFLSIEEKTTLSAHALRMIANQKS
jgi:hypothetical protein